MFQVTNQEFEVTSRDIEIANEILPRTALGCPTNDVNKNIFQSTQCPIATCIKRVLGFSVERIMSGHHSIEINDYRYDTPDSVRVFMQAYDKGEIVQSGLRFQLPIVRKGM